MLYTVIPVEDVFEGMDEESPVTSELTLGGITLEVELLGEFQARVVRVLSTDPRHFLEPNCQPGAVISGQIV
ncbi:MAG: hypothetical protein GX971_06685 [Firmicutes bacterium]|nr:hypothetical protein [Bacillota bacterium]